eukprot:04430_5
MLISVVGKSEIDARGLRKEIEDLRFKLQTSERKVSDCEKHHNSDSSAQNHLNLHGNANISHSLSQMYSSLQFVQDSANNQIERLREFNENIATKSQTTAFKVPGDDSAQLIAGVLVALENIQLKSLKASNICRDILQKSA